MKKSTRLFFVSAMMMALGTNAFGQDRLLNFNDDWLFTLSDSHDYSLTTYKPSGQWKKLDLPHDWSIESDFDKNLEGCTAYMPGGIGWYSKSFDTTINDNQKCFVIFDGVYNNAQYWLNGMQIGNHPYGYAPVFYDLTDIMAPEGKTNRLSVRVDHSRYADSRWYTGSGIYRNVKMLITNKLHIPVWGTYLTTPKVSEKESEVKIEVRVKNDYDTAKKCNLITDIFDDKGQKVATVSTPVQLDADVEKIFTQTMTIGNAKLWSVSSPYLYTAKSHLDIDAQCNDSRVTTFGIRSIRFDKDKGFFLNGVNMKIKGVCLHHDAGVVGTAVPKDVWRRRLTILKQGGCNAIRCSHNPASDEFLELCDELGFLVQNEFYDEWDMPKDKRYNMQDKEVDYITRGHSEHFQEWAEIDLKNVMRSSRNHPSVFQWSIGNEIEWTYPGTRGATGIFKGTDENDKMDWTNWRTEIPPHSPEQVREYWKNYPKQRFNIGKTAAKLAKWTREMDVTRPVTANCILPTSSFETGYTDALDVVGFSYKPAKYDYFKRTYPDKVMMGTENVPRWYEWKAALERDFISGIFLWTGVDYLGERRIEQWPEKATPEGPLNLAGFPRGSYYQYKSFWSDEPVIAIYSQTEKKSIFKRDNQGNVVEKKEGYWKLAPRVWQNVNPYWNYNDGEDVIVEIYSNCEKLELFLNGKSLGKRNMNEQDDRICKWYTKYSVGKLEAVGTMSNGQKIKKVIETVGEPVAIRLTPDRNSMSANNTDVVHVVAQLVDSKGREVKNVDCDITFDIDGDYRFLGTDCGNTKKMTGYKHKTSPTEFGQCLLVLQATKNSGDISIKARTDNGKIASKVLMMSVK